MQKWRQHEQHCSHTLPCTSCTYWGLKGTLNGTLKVTSLSIWFTSWTVKCLGISSSVMLNTLMSFVKTNHHDCCHEWHLKSKILNYLPILPIQKSGTQNRLFGRFEDYVGFLKKNFFNVNCRHCHRCCTAPTIYTGIASCRCEALISQNMHNANV